ncbi:MAG TPA: hypothetical protein VNE71_07515, partial [Myxococcota bacterium]|nr:hypothetical protein [Myxococcota bacterium]
MRRARVDAVSRAAPVLLAALALAGACGRSEPGAPPQAPVAIRGGVVIEPPELTIGQTATVEVAVVTPPNHRLEPFEGPSAVEGLWILGVEQPPPDRTEGRWVHRVLFRVRSRTTGDLVWPAAIAFVGTPDGERIPVALAERPLRVAEIAGEHSERTEPFTYRAARDDAAERSFLLPALLGAALTAAALALTAVVRRARAARSAAAAVLAEAPRVSPDVRAERALDAAIAAIEADPVGAAGAASAALRAWVADRVRRSAPRPTRGAAHPVRRRRRRSSPRSSRPLRCRERGPSSSRSSAGSTSLASAPASSRVRSRAASSKAPCRRPARSSPRRRPRRARRDRVAPRARDARRVLARAALGGGCARRRGRRHAKRSQS